MSRVRVLQGAILIDRYYDMNDNFSDVKNSIVAYFKGVRTEWGKITWPEKHQVIVENFFVVAIVFVFTVFIYFVDVIFNTLLSKI